MKKNEVSLFRGATKPAMMMGVPFVAFGFMMIPISIGVGISMFVGSWGYLMLLVPVVMFPVCRELTKQDDQLLRMLSLDFAEKFGVLSNNKWQGNYCLPPRSINKKGFYDEGN